MIRKQRSTAILALTSLGLSIFASAASAETDYLWPYEQLSLTSFARVVGPNAADASFIINGRPMGFGKIDPELQELGKEIQLLLKDAEQAKESTSQAVVLLTEPISYLKNAREALANLGNPSLKLTESGDLLEVLFTPPRWSLGYMEITLYDALAAINARTREFGNAYSNMAKSYELKKKAYGLDSDEVAQQLIDIASLNEDAHNYNAAEKYFKQAYDIAKRTHGENSKEASAVLMQLCMVPHGGCPSAGNNALSIMDRLGIKTAGFNLPNSKPHFWTAEKSNVKSVLSSAKQAVARQKAEITAM